MTTRFGIFQDWMTCQQRSSQQWLVVLSREFEPTRQTLYC